MNKHHRSEEEIRREAGEIRAAKKDPQRFAVLYDRYFQPVFAFVYRRVGERDLTGELVSLVFLKAMVGIKTFRPKGVPFSAWLFRIAINEINMFYRKAGRVQVVSLDEAVTAAIIHDVEAPDNEDNRRRLADAMARLSAAEANILEMRFFEEMSYRDIGQVLGIREAAAKIRAYRALGRLRSFMGRRP